MSELTITVRGEHEVRIAPEQATVHLSVTIEGPHREDVVERALALAATVRDGIAAREESGAIAEWSSTRMGVRAERPWNSEGKRLAPVYHATVEFTATFSDLSEMSVWVTEVSVGEGVTIGATVWKLTPETRRRVEQEVAAEAVGVAVSRATAYATALGYERVEPIEVADTGMISSRPTPVVQERGALRAAAAFAAPAGDAGMQFQAEDIVVAATVEARFLAR
ncbi:SIMPL domain-containing protein [Streptomyces sp. MS2A]|nr:SIMPL domain-containing protein [Streptomyces sp. MS2A]